MAGSFSSAYSSAYDVGGGGGGSSIVVLVMQQMANILDIVKKGSTDRSVTIRIIDSTTGLPETAVEHNTSGIDLWYRREGAAKVSITEAALSALTDAHSDGGIEHIGDGDYRLDLPDAAFATGANHVDIGGTITGMIVLGGRVRLVDFDPENSVRLGLTALPNAAADAAGGLPISDAGGLDLDAKIGALTFGTANRVNAQVYGVENNAITAASINTGAIDADALAPDAVTEIQSGLATSGAVADVQSAVDNVSDIVNGIDTAIGALNDLSTADIDARLAAIRLDELLAADSDIDGAAPPTVGSVFHELMSKTTGSFTFDQTTDSCEAVSDKVTAAHGAVTAVDTDVDTVLARLGSFTGSGRNTVLGVLQAICRNDQTAPSDIGGSYTASLQSLEGLHTFYLDPAATSLTSILADTNELQTDWANGGRLDLLIDAIKAKTDNLPSDPADASDVAAGIAGLDTDIAAVDAKVSALWTTAITEAYRADGAAPTPAQAICEILGHLNEVAISGTSYRVNKFDGLTQALILTLNDATPPP